MTDMTVVPSGYAGDYTDFLKAPGAGDGTAKVVTGSVTVPDATVQNAYVGLVPFRKGAKFKIDNASVHVGNIGDGSATCDLGIIYDDHSNNTNDEDAFVSASTAPRSGGFLTVDETSGLTLETTGDGWLAYKHEASAVDAEGDITFSFIVQYG